MLVGNIHNVAMELKEAIQLNMSASMETKGELKNVGKHQIQHGKM